MRARLLRCWAPDEGDVYCALCFDCLATNFVAVDFDEPHNTLFGLVDDEYLLLGFCRECWSQRSYVERLILAIDLSLEEFELEAERN